MQDFNKLDWENFIKEKCKEAGISFRQLSKRVNMSDVGLSKTLSNRTIKLMTIIEISVALQIDLHQLINSLSFGTNTNMISLLSFQQNKIEKLETELEKNKKYTSALESINEKTKLLRKYEDKEEIESFEKFLAHLKKPKEDIIGLFIEYQEWKKAKENKE